MAGQLLATAAAYSLRGRAGSNKDENFYRGRKKEKYGKKERTTNCDQGEQTCGEKKKDIKKEKLFLGYKDIKEKMSSLTLSIQGMFLQSFTLISPVGYFCKRRFNLKVKLAIVICNCNLCKREYECNKKPFRHEKYILTF